MATAAPDKRLQEVPDAIYAKFSFAAFVFFVVFEVAYFAKSSSPYDIAGYLIGRDFVNTWMGAKSAFTGGPAAWFDLNTYNQALQQRFGTWYPIHNWSYPPHLLLFSWPFGFLSYIPAYVVWSLIGFALYLWVLSAGDYRRERLLFLAVAPAVVVNLFTGQNGFFTAALLIGGLTQLDRRPVIAGILFGVLTIKPQLGILLPVMLLLTGRWRCIMAAIVTAAVLVAVTSAIYGLDIWIKYFSVAMSVQKQVLAEGEKLFFFMPTVFISARAFGLELGFAYFAQAIVSGLCVVAVIWTFWRRRDPVLSLALLITAIFLMTPYAFSYDMVVFGWVVAKLRDTEGRDLLDDRLALAVWTLPVIIILLGLIGLYISPFVIMAFAGRLLWRLWKSTPKSTPAPSLLT